MSILIEKWFNSVEIFWYFCKYWCQVWPKSMRSHWKSLKSHCFLLFTIESRKAINRSTVEYCLSFDTRFCVQRPNGIFWDEKTKIKIHFTSQEIKGKHHVWELMGLRGENSFLFPFNKLFSCHPIYCLTCFYSDPNPTAQYLIGLIVS